MEDLLHGCVVVRLEEAQASRCNIVLELPVKVHRGEGSLLKRIRFADFELVHVDLLLLLVQHEHMSVVASALRREGTEVGHDGLSTRNVVSFDVGAAKGDLNVLNQRST